MEPRIIQEKVETFMRACQALAGFVHHNKLTEKERLAVVGFVRVLELEVEPPIPLLFPGRPAISYTLSNLLLID